MTTSNSTSGSDGVKVQSSNDINKAIKNKLQRSNRVKISGLKEQDNIAVGLEGNCEVNIHGNAGIHLAAFNNGAVIILEGNCGDLAGDTLLKGGLIVFGNAGDLLGANMNNGIIVIKGNAGDGVGKYMSGGTIIIDGDIHGSVGVRMSDGMIIITGSLKGRLCPGSTGGMIFIGGEIPPENNISAFQKPTPKDVSKLSKYFEHYSINAIPKTMRKFKGGN
jgi:formylmethanofuran dehydrogenase subunit C